MTSEPWLPEDFEHPLVVELSTGDHVRPIRETDVEIDYPAVMGSRERLWAMFGEPWGWPTATMTFEHDQRDLARHERENNAHESFCYAILDPAETRILGCIYVDPPKHDGADADISWWIVDDAVGTPLEAALDEFLPRWLTEAWPFTTLRAVGRELP